MTSLAWVYHSRRGGNYKYTRPYDRAYKRWTWYQELVHVEKPPPFDVMARLPPPGKGFTIERTFIPDMVAEEHLPYYRLLQRLDSVMCQRKELKLATHKWLAVVLKTNGYRLICE